MLETFRKRENPRDNVRPPGTTSPPVRQPIINPQVRINETKNEPPHVDPPAPPQVANPQPPAAEKTPVQSQPQAQQGPGMSAGGTARLIVGAEIKLKGAEINDCDTLIVEGQVDASMTSRVIEVAKTGLFRGKVQVEFAEVQGRFEGELTAHKQLMIRSSGRVSGKIRYGTILIEEGGELSGDVAVAEASAAARAHAPAAPQDATESSVLRESTTSTPLNRAAGAGAAQR